MSMANFSERIREDEDFREELVSAIEDMTYQLAKVGDDG